jgi:hypothetical protein
VPWNVSETRRKKLRVEEKRHVEVRIDVDME